MRMTAVLGLVGLILVGWGAASFIAPNKTVAPSQSGGQSVDHRQIRQTMFTAASRLENSPCDPKLKEPLRTAIVAYIADARETGQAPDSSALAIAEGAGRAGIVGMWDLLPLSFMGRRQEPMQTFGALEQRFQEQTQSSGEQNFQEQLQSSVEQFQKMVAEERHFACNRGGADADNERPLRVLRSR